MRKRVYAVGVSDIHLANEESRPRELLCALQGYDYEKVIVVGDLHEDGGDIDEDQFELVTYLRENKNRVVYVDGNHDDSEHNLISRMIGVQVKKKHEETIGGKRFCFLHGHQFDKMCFVFSYPLVDKMFTYATSLLKKVKIPCFDAEDLMNRFHNRFSERVAKQALKYAAKYGYDKIVCGHTHIPLHRTKGEIEYFNCGGWLGNLQTLLTIEYDGTTVLHSIC